MPYPCEIKEQVAQPTVSIRTRTPAQNLPQVLGRAYGAILQYLIEQGEEPAGPSYVAYFNMDMQNLDIEAGFPVARKLVGKGDIQVGEFRSGKVATCLHVGPYSEIGAAYEALQHWMKEQGLEPTGEAYEMYLDDPQRTPPAQLRTQIVFPIRP